MELKKLTGNTGCDNGYFWEFGEPTDEKAAPEPYDASQVQFDRRGSTRTYLRISLEILADFYGATTVVNEVSTSNI